MPNSDNRHFTRYEKDSDVALKFRKKHFYGRMTNYSLDGVSAVFETIIPVGKGDNIEFTALDPQITLSGEIVWSVIERSSLRIGVKKVSTVTGLSKDYRFADTLIGLQRGRKTGVLTFEKGPAIKKIYLIDGDVVFADSNLEEDSLASILLRDGGISSDQYNYSAAQQKKTGQKQAMILVRLGYIDPKWIITAERYRVEEIIKSVFLLEEGNFYLDERPLAPEEIIPLKLSASSLIYHGIKGINEPRLISPDLPSPDAVPFFSSDPLSLFQDLKLDPAGRKVISLIDGRSSIKDIISLSALNGFEVLKTICGLLNTRVIEIRDKKDDDEIPETVIDEIVRENIEEVHHESEESLLDEEVRRLHDRYRELGYYGILGINRNASAREIKTAYYRAAKKFHPDMHFHLSDRSLKGKLSDIFSYVYESYRTLSDLGKKQDYDARQASGQVAQTTTAGRASAYFEVGRTRLEAEDYEEAERLFSQAAYYDPANPVYQYHYGLSLARQNKSKPAMKAFEKACSLAPSNPDYISELGFAYLGLGMPRRARGLFEKALKISAEHMRANEGMEKVNASS